MPAERQGPYVVERLGDACIVHVIAGPLDVLVVDRVLLAKLEITALIYRLAVRAGAEDVQALLLLGLCDAWGTSVCSHAVACRSYIHSVLLRLLHRSGRLVCIIHDLLEQQNV